MSRIRPPEIGARWVHLVGPARPSPHMIYFQRVKSPRLLAITHVDGSAAQSVNDLDNPCMSNLLREFRRQSGCGVLCNTSLNFKGHGSSTGPASCSRAPGESMSRSSATRSGGEKEQPPDRVVALDTGPVRAATDQEMDTVPASKVGDAIFGAKCNCNIGQLRAAQG